MYEKKSYKIMVAFDILTDIDPNYKSRFGSSEEMYQELINYIDQFEQIDNNNKSWYESFNQFLTNKIYYNIKQEV
tara:strand:+ start:240 stop:464 length:225 start_codon:yes stop_codon:yes gene_type:complete